MEAPASAKRTRGAPAASALPDEIVEEILARLPAKSLVRLQNVSRSWRGMITSPAFHDLHSKRASHRNRNRTLLIRPGGNMQPFYTWRPCEGPLERIMDPTFQLPQGHVFPITNACRGLVLLRCHEYDTHYVWNPSTREMLTLPDRRPFMTVRNNRRRGPFVSYGMGFCSTTNRYKVVRMYHLTEPVEATVCEVFTLDESAYWKPAAMKPPLCRIRPNSRHGAVLCNGNLHFIGEDGVITTFSVTDERFGTLMPPLEINDRFDLTDLDGQLCAYDPMNPYPTPEYPYKIWLLREYATERRRWEELRCIDWGTIPEVERASLRSCWTAPLGVYYNDSDKAKKIIFGTGFCKVFAVDPRNGVPEIMLSLDAICRDSEADSVYPIMGLFEESLRSVGRTSNEIIRLSPSVRVWWEVLSRLPASMVGRLNQVCKEWRAMIKSELFVDIHLYQTNLNKSPQVMFTDGKPERFKFIENFINTSDVPPLIDDGSRVFCSKPCHGLNAGSFAHYDFVCNPVTDYYTALPVGNDFWELRGVSLHDDIAWISVNCSDDAVFAGRFGLGYNEEMGKHVLVRLAYIERNLTTRTYKLECKIRYVEDMLWTRIDPPPRPIANMPPAYANGKIYWIVDAEFEERSSSHEIIVLDVSTGKFEVLKGPPCIHHDNIKRVSIHELQGMVCVACSHYSTGTIEIWAMEDTSSWSVKYRIELMRFSPEYSLELTAPLAVDPMDGRILLSTGRALGYYNPKKMEVETIYRLGKYVQGKKFVPILFQESLVFPCDPI